MKKILIAVPAHDYVHADFTRCLMELEKPDNVGFALITNTLIYTARNLIAQNAVKHGFDYVLWLDSDMVFPADTLIRLYDDMEEGRDFVTALCFTRKPPILPCIDSEIVWAVKDDGWVDTHATSMEIYPVDKVFEVAGAGFACCMTSTALLKRMCDKYGAPFYPLMGMGEDTTFCWRAGQIGEKIYCDSRIRIKHIGQYAFGQDDYIEQRKWRPDR
jgi:GT2 family glycosyltransferase